MTLPKNFPGRKNARRIAVLEKLENIPEENRTFSQTKDIHNLTKNVTDMNTTRKIKTKKIRGTKENKG